MKIWWQLSKSTVQYMSESSTVLVTTGFLTLDDKKQSCWWSKKTFKHIYEWVAYSKIKQLKRQRYTAGMIFICKYCYKYYVNPSSEEKLGPLKGIVSWDFDGIFMLLSYSLDVRQLPLNILFFNFDVFIFKWFFQSA
jgi:hypothetical protein